MPPNPFVDETEAATILKYVLSLADPAGPRLPLAGEFTPKLPPRDPGTGAILVWAVYTDAGDELAPPLTGESLRLLRSPVPPVTEPRCGKGWNPPNAAVAGAGVAVRRACPWPCRTPAVGTTCSSCSATKPPPTPQCC